MAMPTATDEIPSTITETLVRTVDNTANPSSQPRPTVSSTRQMLRTLGSTTAKKATMSTTARPIAQRLSVLICRALVTAMVGAPICRTFSCIPAPWGAFAAEAPSACASTAAAVASISATRRALRPVSLRPAALSTSTSACRPSGVKMWSS